MYEVFDGHRRDVTTLEEMVGLMEDKYSKARRVWVLDRGFVSEDNEQLQKIKKFILAGRLKEDVAAAKRIGRWSGRYSKADRLIEVALVKDAAGRLVDLKIERRMERAEWAEKANGCFSSRRASSPSAYLCLFSGVGNV